jgi:hypothetical protein
LPENCIMDMDSKSIRVCPLLRGGPENYSIWKSKMEMTLIRERLWSIISQRRTKPETGAKALSDFEEDAERATATIFLHLSETAELYVHDLRNPVTVYRQRVSIRSNFSSGPCQKSEVIAISE